MTISSKDWNNYISRLSSLSKTAAEQMTAYVNTHGLGDRDAIIRYAYALATKYGEGSAELACEMYDAMAEISGVIIAPAEPAATATYGETAKAINGSLLQSPSGQLIDSVVDRLVKQAASDTTLKNARRDGAQWAWIPAGDTCAFCLTLASRGWQSASKAQMKGDHATHIHAHCDCQFQIRFDSSTNVEGYDPDALLEQYYAAEGNSSKEKINSLRRMQYKSSRLAATKEQIRIPQIPASTIARKVELGEYSLKYSQQQFDKHVEGTRDYERYKESKIKKTGSPPSIITISKQEAENIIRTHYGTGIIKVDSRGEGMNIEHITCDGVVGKYWDHGKWHETKKCAIHYGNHGAHIVPIKGSHYD